MQAVLLSLGSSRWFLSHARWILSRTRCCRRGAFQKRKKTKAEVRWHCYRLWAARGLLDAAREVQDAWRALCFSRGQIWPSSNFSMLYSNSAYPFIDSFPAPGIGSESPRRYRNRWMLCFAVGLARIPFRWSAKRAQFHPCNHVGESQRIAVVVIG